MKISDAIRMWCNRPAGPYEDLRYLASRIDSETVELPKDADGVPIHVGDTVWGCRSHVKMEVAALRIEGSGWAVYVDGGKCRVDALDVSHERPDSLECIADELDEMVDAARWADYSCEKLADLADRILKLAKKDDK